MPVRSARPCRICSAPLGLAWLPEPDRGTAEIVLAEVLNNIVEHAQAPKAGDIEVLLSHTTQGLACTVIDRGLRMPGGRLPEGVPASLSVPTGDLPEGGFGWHLIRLLATDLAYRRHGDRNELSFRLRLDMTSPDVRRFFRLKHGHNPAMFPPRLRHRPSPVFTA